MCESIRYEIMILESLQQLGHLHENCCFAVGITDERISKICYEIMKEGNLRDKIREKYETIDAVNIAIQVARGLAHIHSKRIIHRNIKASNILFSHNNVAKISDYGTSIQLIDDIQYYHEDAETGSYRYMAPEVIKHEPYDYKVDIYSIGLVLWEMLHREKVFEGVDQMTVAFRVAKNELTAVVEEEKEVTHPRMAALVERSTSYDPSLRPKSEEIVQILSISF
jgi:serine/threonine protein kinase